MRYRPRIALGMLCIVAAVVLYGSTTAAQDGPKVRVLADPDIQVSYDTTNAHLEGPVVASMTDPNALVAVTETMPAGRPNVAVAQAYYSSDAGVSWTAAPLPASVLTYSWDNALAASRNGSIYFITHRVAVDRAVAALMSFRTRDGGRTWSSARISKVGDGWDREFAAVDNTGGRFGGRLYVAGESYGKNMHGKDSISVVWSDDDGRTFSRPSRACPQPSTWSAETAPSLLVLRDGTIVVPCMPYAHYPLRGTLARQRLTVVVSSDGGHTFSMPRTVGFTRTPLTAEWARNITSGNAVQGDGWSNGVYGVGPPGTHFADRLYAAWALYDRGHPSHIVSAYSVDRGRHWSRPVPVDAVVPDGPLLQSNPMLAVAKDGTVGIGWFDARHATGGRGYDVYFSASVDGGVSFLPAVRVSSATSFPARGANTWPAPSEFIGTLADKMLPAGKGRTVAITSPYATRRLGGDYVTVAADGASRFHPVWYDARNGAAFQLYTSTIRVAPIASAAAAGPVVTAGMHCDITKSTSFVYGESRWDAHTGIATVPVRLENDAATTRTGPLSVRLQWTALPDGRGLNTNSQPITLFDAATGTYAAIATIDYPASPEHPLFQHGVTAEHIWRLRVKTAELMNFFLRARVFAAAPCSPP